MDQLAEIAATVTSSLLTNDCSPKPHLQPIFQSLRGIVFRCTIRGGHASLAVIVTRLNFLANDGSIENREFQLQDSESDAEKLERIVLVVIRFGGSAWHRESAQAERSDAECETVPAADIAHNIQVKQNNENVGSNPSNEAMTQMRSNIRRLCKMGNEIEFRGTFIKSTSICDTNNDIAKSHWERFAVDYYLPSSFDTESNVRMCHVRKWDAPQCQIVRAKYFSTPVDTQPPNRSIDRCKNGNSQEETIMAKTTNQRRQTLREEKQEKNDSFDKSVLLNSNCSHGGGIGKRKQGEIVADFLVWMLYTKYLSVDSKEKMPSSSVKSPSFNGSFENRAQNQQQQNYLWMQRYLPLDPSLESPNTLSTSNRNRIVAGIIQRGQEEFITFNGKHIDGFDGHRTLNSRTGGIIDAAGGAGHVSLALSLRGIHSTVVDPRPSVGKLPGRDRKVLKKALSLSTAYVEDGKLQCGVFEKVVPFSTYRAWFGVRPNGVDSFFREGCLGTMSRTLDLGEVHIDMPCNECNRKFQPENKTLLATGLDDLTTLPICSMCSEDRLLPNCDAIVALHPDEATGSIVETAVEHKIPFVVVPCCVFSRLFPERIKPDVRKFSMALATDLENIGEKTEKRSDGNEGVVVSTYNDLIDWLVAKHPAIHVTQLPFDGANLAVWATF